MQTLFPDLPSLPAGFRYEPDFLTEAEERELCFEISKLELHTFTFQGFEAKRKVASFGYDYSFDKKTVSEGIPIPKLFHPLLDKVAEHIRIPKENFSELLVTEYPIGSVINWHRDAFPFEIIAGISSNADCIFRLRPYEKVRQGRGSIISIPVQRRSLYVMQGEARMNWQHSIAPVKAKRYSITLRTMKQ